MFSNDLFENHGIMSSTRMCMSYPFLRLADCRSRRVHSLLLITYIGGGGDVSIRFQVNLCKNEPNGIGRDLNSTHSDKMAIMLRKNQ